MAFAIFTLYCRACGMPTLVRRFGSPVRQRAASAGSPIACDRSDCGLVAAFNHRTPRDLARALHGPDRDRRTSSANRSRMGTARIAVPPDRTQAVPAGAGRARSLPPLDAVIFRTTTTIISTLRHCASWRNSMCRSSPRSESACTWRRGASQRSGSWRWTGGRATRCRTRSCPSQPGLPSTSQVAVCTIATPRCGHR